MPRLTVEQAAEYIPCSPVTLNHYRIKGGGPDYIKLGAKVLYDTVDLDAWLKKNKRNSTSETPKRQKARAAP